ncbi:MAG: VOC family protein [Bacteroidota bacterium]
MNLNKQFFLIVMLGTLFGCGPKEEANHMQIDHLILAINDLEVGIEKCERLTGIRAVYGGEHPNSFTHNAIVSLGHQMYLEILAPKHGLDSIPEFFKNINELKPIGFAISVEDIKRLEESILALQFDTKGVEDWARKKADGEELTWELLQIQGPDLDINPFFISWSRNTKHPSLQQNPQIALKELSLNTPFKNEIMEILSANKAKISLMNMKEDQAVGLRFTIQSPQGEIVFQ